MKTALCLHGYFNSQRDGDSRGIDGYRYIEDNILSKSDVDVYIHSWDLKNEMEICSLYSNNIISSVFEKQKDFKILYNQNGLGTLPQREGVTPFWNVFSQFYSVQRVFKLLQESGNKYDCVIKSRFDLGRINRASSGPHNRMNPHPVQCINFDDARDMSKFYMANWQRERFDEEGPADMWFYSSQKNMRAFERLFDIAAADIKINSPYQEWAGEKHGGMTNTIKAWKHFLITTGLWEKRELLEGTWI